MNDAPAQAPDTEDTAIRAVHTGGEANHFELNDAGKAAVAAARANPAAVKAGGRQGGKTAATKKAKAAAKPKTPKVAKPKKDRAPKLASKADTVIALLRREAGATMQEMQEATSWKPHSVRAFISAGLKKKGLQVTKQKHEGGVPTTFHLPEPAEAI